MSAIIGLNLFHGDSSACLVVDGKLIAAAEEERFKRIKHWAGFPLESIKYCLKEGDIDINLINHIAINSDPKAHALKKIIYTLKNRPDPKFIIDRIKNKKSRMSIETLISESFPSHSFEGKIHNIEHHLCHLASSYFVSPFENSVAISVDGFGDFASSAWGVCEGNNISLDDRIFFPHSLGIFYQAMTQFLGFPHYGDEYKVMGMAAYGEPKFHEKMKDIISYDSSGKFKLNLDYFIHHNTKVDYQWADGSPTIGTLFDENKLESLLGIKLRKKDEKLEQIHFDMAHSIQSIYEEVFFNILNVNHARYMNDNLSLAGGCAMNSLANGKIFRKSEFKNIYIQSAAGDAGGAIGAAYMVASENDEIKEKYHMEHAFYGPSYDNTYHEDLLKLHSDQLPLEQFQIKRVDDDMELCRTTAKAISKGQVIGWFQGRMEWGPRALGNRSILCDPRRSDIREILNLKIKRRESFRPFAPAILKEEVKNWFTEDYPVPFMMQVFEIQENKHKIIPAVTHADGTGRLQTVDKKTNLMYYNLISEFKEITGVPIVLNTSFNENEPVVCKPDEALNTFLRTKMDLLVLGNWTITRL
jgi:carbamoyltransferase